MTQPIDKRYESTLRRIHEADRVSRGVEGHGPCDVCFLLARLDQLARKNGHMNLTGVIEDTSDWEHS